MADSDFSGILCEAGGAAALARTATLDFREDLVNDGVLGHGRAQRCIQTLQEFRDSFCISGHQCDACRFPCAARTARRMGGISPIVI